MTTHKEVLTLALEMVQNKMYAHAEMYLKEALAQEQEPVAHTAIFHCPNCEYPHRQVTHITGTAQPPWSPQRKEQGPMAWMCHPFGDDECEFSDHQECENCIPLYTTPQQRTWVGLSREDCYQVRENESDDFMYGVAWAEAKLKEKNT